MSNPYSDLGPDAFWRSAVAEKNPLQIQDLWTPKHRIDQSTRIVTAGSCFAQHISRAMMARGYRWLDCEPCPSVVPQDIARDYTYGVFSFRTGNIYTARMLKQWLQLAFGTGMVADEVWEQDGRFFDPLRPAIEPGGFASRDELMASRAATLAAIRKAVTETNVFVFTLGLTESWYNAETGLEYAMCPGTAAGRFDPERHKFRNHDVISVIKDVQDCLRLMRQNNGTLKILLTVSPVPLTATASGQHVLTATSGSKAILRAAAAHFTDRYRFVDYFPSYEIITHPAFRGMFYGPNARSVVPEGVDFVMTSFFRDQQRVFPDKPGRKQAPPPQPATGDVRCEEEMLNAFASANR